jgi:hypothetical protein
MAGIDGAEPYPELPKKELARLKHRDRKRETRMVVDNAGVKRVIPAVRKRASRTKKPGET